jgi:hypothetical protein
VKTVFRGDFSECDILLVNGDGNMDRICKTASKQARALELAELSRKTGLMVRTPDSAEIDFLFAELEKDDSQERAETFEYLKSALNETRASLRAEPAYLDE